LLFLAGGAISFLCCFFVTRTYLWHKRRILINRLRNEWSEDTTDPDIRIIHRPHQRSTRLLHKYKYNQQLKKVAVDVNADEKRPIVGERSSGADGTGGVKLWAPQTPQGKIGENSFNFA
uniref:Pecanex-like protein n=1 Tax=Globodera pallida TaxID=36090 RepID=A0A183CQL7_GLOPA